MSQLANPLGFSTSSVFGTPSAILVGISDFHRILDDDIETTFINPNEFAKSVTYTHRTGEVEIYNVIEDDPNNELQLNMSAVSDIDIEVLFHESRFIRRPTKGDKFTMDGIIYSIVNWKPDGVGIVLINAKREGNEQPYNA